MNESSSWMSFMPSSLFLPQRTPRSEGELWRWFSNLALELASSSELSEAGRELLRGYYTDAGLLHSARKRYFRQLYTSTLLRLLSHLPDSLEGMRILDLGAGCGTQSLLFALLGAEVLAVDLDEVALQVLKERAARYAREVGSELKVTVLREDAFTVPYATYGPYDLVYSLFAFNMMQPSSDLLSRLLPQVRKGGLFSITDGNRLAWYSRLLPHRRRMTLSPQELAQEIERFEFQVVESTGAVALPPLLWNVPAHPLLSMIDRWACGRSALPVSYQLVARRGA